MRSAIVASVRDRNPLGIADDLDTVFGHRFRVPDPKRRIRS